MFDVIEPHQICVMSESDEDSDQGFQGAANNGRPSDFVEENQIQENNQ